MRSERTRSVLRDLLHQINLAIEFVDGYDRKAFDADVRTV